MSIREPFFIGLDDGYNTSIGYTERGETVLVPSRIRIGKNDAGIKFEGVNTGKSTVVKHKPQVYQADDTFYTVNAAISTDTISDDYPYSGANRVMVHHVLNQINNIDKEQPIHLCSGLPILTYYKRSGELNMEAINRKQDNLKMPVNIITDGRSTESLQVTKNAVMPEGIAAVFDLGIEEIRKSDNRNSANPKLKRHDDVFDQHIAIVDCGGRTLDIAIWSAGNVERGNFKTENVGIEDIRRQVGDAIKDEYGLHELRDDQIEKAINTGALQLRKGHTVNVTDIRDEARKDVVTRIKTIINNVIGSRGKMIDQIVFIGGGSKFLYEHGLSGMYEQQRLIDDPIAANARGFFKYLKYFASNG